MPYTVEQSQSSLAPLESVARKLLESPNPFQQRTGRDFEVLAALADGRWSDQCRLLGVRAANDRSLCVLLELKVPGLIWDGQLPQAYDLGFLAALIVPASYPKLMPQMRFLGSGELIPFCPHVLHGGCPIDEQGLPTELRSFVQGIRRRESGWCCYAKSSAWSPLVTHDLALCLWLVSSLVTGSQYWGELGSLNNLALAEFNRLKKQCALPLGNPLPFPREDTRPVMVEDVDDGIEIEIQES